MLVHFPAKSGNKRVRERKGNGEAKQRETHSEEGGRLLFSKGRPENSNTAVEAQAGSEGESRMAESTSVAKEACVEQVRLGMQLPAEYSP